MADIFALAPGLANHADVINYSEYWTREGQKFYKMATKPLYQERVQPRPWESLWIPRTARQSSQDFRLDGYQPPPDLNDIDAVIDLITRLSIP